MAITRSPDLSVLLVDDTRNIFEADRIPFAHGIAAMSASSMKILCRYAYDPLDRLTGAGLAQPTSTQRFYQENHLTTELGRQTHRTIFRHQAEPLAQRQSATDVTETTLLMTDQAHSLLQAVSGIHSQPFAYTAYGHHPAESGLSRLFGFNGESPDAITGHYLLGQGKRAFNPVLMRFNSPDELSPFGEGGINPYAYCEGDPINFSDPTGNVKWATLIKRFTTYQPTSMTSSTSSPLKTIKPTTTTIKRTSQAERNPILNGLLGPSANNSPRTMPSASTSTTELINLPIHIPSSLAFSNHGAALSSRQLNLNNFGASYNYLKSTPGFKTVATRQQLQALSALKVQNQSAATVAARADNKKSGIELSMEIKKTSVENYYVQLALQEIRANSP